MGERPCNFQNALEATATSSGDATLIEVVRWAGGAGRRAVAAAVAEPRAVVVQGILTDAACRDIAAAVWADAPTVLLVPQPGEDIVSYARNKWTTRAHAPARLHLLRA